MEWWQVTGADDIPAPHCGGEVQPSALPLSAARCCWRTMNERITIRVTADMKEALERFHQEQVTPMRSRQDAFRHIIEDR